MTPSIGPLYLSRLLLNLRSRQVWSELAWPYEMHRTLMRAFPKATNEKEHKARDEFDVLFRAEADEPSSAIKVYVQSRVKPDWSFLDSLNGYLWSDTSLSEYEHKDIMPACLKIQDGQCFSFRLRANPTKRIAKHDDTMKGKRVELTREEEQMAWLIRKGQEREKGKPGGFEILMREVRNQNGEIRRIPRVNVHPEGKQRGRKTEEGHSHDTTHLAVCFDGLLRTTDADAFRETLAKGIGPAKAFGFGLLSVAPVRS